MKKLNTTFARFTACYEKAGYTLDDDINEVDDFKLVIEQDEKFIVVLDQGGCSDEHMVASFYKPTGDLALYDEFGNKHLSRGDWAAEPLFEGDFAHCINYINQNV